MNENELLRLLRGYLDNNITPADLERLLAHLRDTDAQDVDALVDQILLQTPEKDRKQEVPFSELQTKQVLTHIKSDLRFQESILGEKEQIATIRFYNQPWLKAAVILLIICSSGLYLFRKQEIKVTKEAIALKPSPSKISPGSNKATLTLAGGKVIVLDDHQDGLVSKNEAGLVRKTGDGQLVYDNNTAVKTSGISQNLLTTPKGGEYKLVLSDGTIVHLNSQSSIEFPERFFGSERTVKLTGEAYFEVAKNKQMPFFVKVNGVSVNVLGTHFNVNAYNNSVITTLVEGSVKLTKNGNQNYLLPGQKGVIANQSNQIEVSEAKIDQAIAWTKGYFRFEDDDIVTVMQQVSRWYDVDVEYRGKFSKRRIGGIYNRSKGIKELLFYLEKVGKINFRIEERRIIVME